MMNAVDEIVRFADKEKDWKAETPFPQVLITSEPRGTRVVDNSPYPDLKIYSPVYYGRGHGRLPGRLVSPGLPPNDFKMD